MSACFIGVRVEEFLARRRMISVLFERFSTLDRFYPVVVPSLSSKVVLVTLPDVRSLRTRVTHGPSYLHERNALFFSLLQL